MKHTILIALLTALALPVCSSNDSTGTGADASTDSNANSDTDTDVDTDSDIDTDSDGDTDAETESDSDICEGSGLEPGQYERIIVFDELERTYQLHVPTGYNHTVATPVVFDLHPFATNAWIMNMMTEFRAKGDEEGFIVVQPNGIAGSWNGGPLCCGEAAAEDLDDVGLIRAIRDQIADELCVDMKRVYADGMSNGGYLAHRIACEDTGLFAAIGPVVASIGFESVDECLPSGPIPVAMISGADDEIESREETFNKWVELNDCTDSFEEEQFGVFTCTTYNECGDGVETTHCVGEGVGHCWPGTSFMIYPCNGDLVATDYLWDFFSKFQLP